MRAATPMLYVSFIVAVAAIARGKSVTISTMPAEDVPHYLPPFSAADASYLFDTVTAGGYTVAYSLDDGDAHIGAMLECYDNEGTLTRVWGSPA